MLKLSLSTFNHHMSVLMSAFGKSTYSQVRKDLIWETVKVLEDDEFIGMINEFLKTQRSPPLPRAFDEATKKIMNRKYHHKIQDGTITRSEHQNKPKCAYCCDSGIMEAQIIGENNAVHFHCDCEAAFTQGWDLPRWNENSSQEFKRLQMWPDRHKKWIPTAERPFNKVQEEWTERIKISIQFWKWRKNETTNQGS